MVALSTKKLHKLMSDAIHDCRRLPVGSKISILLPNGEVVVTTIECAREPDAVKGMDRLVTASGTLRWHGGSCMWWRRPLPGEDLMRQDVVSVLPYPAPEHARTHGTFEVVDGMSTVWVRLGAPDGPLVPVRRS